jgi:hypothetical protein
MNLRLANQDGFDDFNHILILVFAIQWCCMNPILNPSFNQLEPSFNRIPVELLAKSRHCFCQMAWSCWTSATRCLTKKRPASRSSKCDIPTNDFRGFQFTVICIVGDYSIIVIHTYSYNIINIYISILWWFVLIPRCAVFLFDSIDLLTIQPSFIFVAPNDASCVIPAVL